MDNLAIRPPCHDWTKPSPDEGKKNYTETSFEFLTNFSKIIVCDWFGKYFFIYIKMRLLMAAAR